MKPVGTVVVQHRDLLLKEDYEKIKALGGDDDSVCVRKAIMVFIEGSDQTEAAQVPELASEEQKTIIQCDKCNASFEISPNDNQTDIECPECGTSQILKHKTKSEVRHKDHFIG